MWVFADFVLPSLYTATGLFGRVHDHGGPSPKDLRLEKKSSKFISHFFARFFQVFICIRQRAAVLPEIPNCQRTATRKIPGGFVLHA
jgi:hypothetical protein